MATKSFLDLTGLEQVKEKIFSTVDEKLKNIKAVKYDEQQELTDAEKLQARQNIGAEGYDWHEVTDPNLMSYTIANVPGVYGIADWDIFELTIYPDDTEFRAFSILLNNLRSLFNYNNRNRLLTKASSVKNLLFTLIDAGAFDSSKHEYQFYRKLDNIIHYRLRYNTDAKSITINSSESDDSSCTYGSGQIIYNYEDNSIVSSDINYPSCYSVLAGDPTAADTYTPSTDANLTTKKYIDDLHLVSYSAQTLTDEQKLQARENIGAEGYNWHSVIGYYNMVYTLSNIPGTEGILDWDIFENTVFTDADGEEWKIFPSMISEFDFIFDYANKDYIIDSLTNTTNYFFDLRDAGAFSSDSYDYQFCRKISDGSINFYNFRLNSSSKSITFSRHTIGGNDPSSGQVIFYYETKEIYTGSSTYINYAPRYYVLNNFTKSDAGKFLGIDDNGDVIAKDIPEQSQSDWDQNDSTEKDYIKNRSHYDNRTLGETITITFDGTIGDKETVTNYFDNNLKYIKISDLTPSLDELENATIKYYMEEEDKYFLLEEQGHYLLLHCLDEYYTMVDGNVFYCCRTINYNIYNSTYRMHIVYDTYEIDEGTTLTQGIWVEYRESWDDQQKYVSLSYTQILGELKQIDPKYIPNEYLTAKDIASRYIEYPSDVNNMQYGDLLYLSGNGVDEELGILCKTPDYVKYTSQTLTDEQKSQVRENINATDKSEVLTKTNTIEYTPTSDYHPVTKKYVDDAVSNSAGIDLSAGQAGQFLVSDGNSGVEFITLSFAEEGEY